MSRLQQQQLTQPVQTPDQTVQRTYAPLLGRRMEPEFCRLSEESQRGHCGLGGQGGDQTVHEEDQGRNWTTMEVRGKFI